MMTDYARHLFSDFQQNLGRKLYVEETSKAWTELYDPLWELVRIEVRAAVVREVWQETGYYDSFNEA